MRFVLVLLCSILLSVCFLATTTTGAVALRGASPTIPKYSPSSVTSKQEASASKDYILGQPIGPSSNPKPASGQSVASIQSLINSMTNRWRLLDSTCDTNAAFSLTYLYMTRGLKSHIESNYFDDNNLMATFTQNFAQRYVDAIDPWINNLNQPIAEPWLEAFKYGKSNMSTTTEDLFLGMNAHINYDLAQVVAGLDYGHLENKKDYDRINDILAEMQGPVGEDISKRYDPSFGSTVTTFFTPAVLQVLFGWRENAWNNGVLLQNAPTSAGKAIVLTTIKTEALAAMRPFMTYNLYQSTYETRKSYCEANHHPL